MSGVEGLFDEREEERGPRGGEKEERQEMPKGTGTSTVENEFGFPILDPTIIVQMKNIPPSTLPNFHGMITEDPKTFLFEFDVLCHSYDYSSDAKKLKLFPTTLKMQLYIGLWVWELTLSKHGMKCEKCFFQSIMIIVQMRDAGRNV
jgi:hypothetical protein